MKQPDIVAKDFVEILHLIEKSINVNLLERGSVGKFLFKDSLNRWFFFYKKNEKVKIHYLQYGFWNFFHEIFSEPNKLYESKDALFPGVSGKYEDVVKRLHISLRRMSKTMEKNQFKDFGRKDNIWNIYAIPFLTDSSKNLRSSVLRAVHNIHDANITTLGQLLITEGVFVSANYITRTNKAIAPQVANKIRNKVNVINALKTINKRMHGSVNIAAQNRISVSADPNKTFRRMSSLSASSRYSDLFHRYIFSDSHSNFAFSRRSSADYINYEPHNPTHRRERIKTRHFIGKNTFEEEDGPQSETVIKPKKDPATLPHEEYIEFLKDLRDILNLHKDYLLLKTNIFYLVHPSNKVANHN